ncbi:DgyrCDS11642 [Dimorphilus gyrociliatus]|uniref:DgyrCDS11642 n=1 Tax=Dimorphilus gyrociliatus TaxID=2664684 RepID=A0A7I8W3Z5_9ANNE|nr:DgyrCDS11642 [Dimorphilus gyrociliatus]
MCTPEQEILKNLTSAIDLSLSQDCSASDRQKAYTFCEDFKANYPDSTYIAFLLAYNQNQDTHRHFGCQLIEHTVKFKWNILSIVDKVGIKDRTTCLVLQGLKNIQDEKDYIKDAVSRIIVEIIKREWPQQWPSLMDELTSLLHSGPVQAQVVLLVLLRLAEDVVALQTVQSQRRKDILAGLNSEMENIFKFMLAPLQKYVEVSSNIPINSEQVYVNTLVARTTLSTLSGYVDWVPVEILLLQDNLLLKLLISLLKSDLKVKAAEVFLLITSRKGRTVDKEALLFLFREEYLQNIIDAVMSVVNKCNFEDFFCLKVLCQSLTAIGIILLSCWKKDIDETYLIKEYLPCMLGFSTHESRALSSLTIPFWSALLKESKARNITEQIFQQFVNALYTNLRKIDQELNPYSCFDFDNEIEYMHFFSKFRNDVTELIRLASSHWPRVMFTAVVEILTARMSQVVNYANANEVNLASVEWDTTSCFVDAVCSKLTQSNEIDMHKILHIFKQMLAFNVVEANILSSLLSCISAFIPYLQYCPDVVLPLLDKTFSAAVYKIDGQTKSTRSRPVKNVRRHACSLVVKMCKQSPHLFLPHFNHLYDHVKRVCADPDELSKMEKCALTEAMLLLSNGFESFEKQRDLIGEILKPVYEFWNSPQYKELIYNPDKFMDSIGLSKPAVDPSTEDIYGILRSQIIHSLFTIFAVVRRVTIPADTNVAVKCGYATVVNGKQYLQNPACDHVKPLLENIIGLQKIYYQLWQPEYIKRRHPDFSKVFLLSESRHVYLSTNESHNEKNPQDRMQNFLKTIHDYSNHILGHYGICLGRNLYNIQGLSEVLVSCLFPGLNLVTDCHVRSVIRTFLKPYFLNCPKEYWSENVLHMLSKFCPFMYSRLEVRWQRIDDYSEAISECETNTESEEVLEDQLLRLLTREYLDLLIVLCFSKKLASNTETESKEMVMDETEAINTSNSSNDLTECGLTICSKEDLFQCLVVTIFTIMVKNDSSSCAKCVNLAQAFRPHHPQLVEVMKQIPNISNEALLNYEKHTMNSSLTDKKKRNAFKVLINGAIGHHISEEYKLKIRIEDLPRLVARNMKVSNTEDISNLGLCELFSNK